MDFGCVCLRIYWKNAWARSIIKTVTYYCSAQDRDPGRAGRGFSSGTARRVVQFFADSQNQL